MNQKNKEKIQSKYTEFQLLSQQISQLEEQLNNVSEHLSELVSLKNNITELRNVKKDTETLIHLGQNIFTKSKIVDTDDFIIGVGAGVLVNKNSNSVVEFIAGQIKELEELDSTMKEKINYGNSRIHELQDELSAMIEEENKNEHS